MTRRPERPYPPVYATPIAADDFGGLTALLRKAATVAHDKRIAGAFAPVAPLFHDVCRIDLGGGRILRIEQGRGHWTAALYRAGQQEPEATIIARFGR